MILPGPHCLTTFKQQEDMNLPTVSVIIPHLSVQGDDRRDKGLQKCIDSIKAQDYPLGHDGESKISILVLDGQETVPQKVKMGVEQTTGDYIVYAANDMWFEPGAIQTAVLSSLAFKKAVVAFNDGMVLPDKGNIAAHFLIRRDFLPQLEKGEIFSTDFWHVGCDNWLHAQAEAKGQFLRSELSIAHHNHFSVGGAPYDAVYEKGWVNKDKDRKTLKEKLAWLKSTSEGNQ